MYNYVILDMFHQHFRHVDSGLGCHLQKLSDSPLEAENSMCSITENTQSFHVPRIEKYEDIGNHGNVSTAIQGDEMYTGMFNTSGILSNDLHHATLRKSDASHISAHGDAGHTSKSVHISSLTNAETVEVKFEEVEEQSEMFTAKNSHAEIGNLPSEHGTNTYGSKDCLPQNLALNQVVFRKISSDETNLILPEIKCNEVDQITPKVKLEINVEENSPGDSNERLNLKPSVAKEKEPVNSQRTLRKMKPEKQWSRKVKHQIDNDVVSCETGIDKKRKCRSASRRKTKHVKVLCSAITSEADSGCESGKNFDLDKFGKSGKGSVKKKKATLESKLQCSKDAEKKRGRKAKQEKAPKLRSKPTPAQPMLHCKWCDKPFKFQCNLNDHENKHSGNRPHVCNICSKGFMSRNDLRTHEKIHGPRNHVCSSCGMEFYKLSHLLLHEKRRHTPKTKIQRGLHSKKDVEKKFFCSMCGGGFTTKPNLVIHEKYIHSEKSEFKCDECGKFFRSAGILRTHKRIHSGARPYECSICNQLFRQSAHLKTHMVKHTDERPFDCPICGRQFKTKNDMKQHMKRHNVSVVSKCFDGFGES